MICIRCGNPLLEAYRQGRLVTAHVVCPPKPAVSVLTKEQWQFLFDRARRLPQRVGVHPTCNEVRNWLAELLEGQGFEVDQYNQIRPARVEVAR